MNAFIRKIYYALPVNLRYTARRLLYLPADLFRDRNSLVPPKGMIFTGRGDYLLAGETFFSYFLKYGGITPQSHVLDVGSGIGRMAVPFTKYLDKDGSYKGFDIVKLGVDWCTKNISSRYPNFRFTHTPLKNDLYNLDTQEQASQFRFPYADSSFDFAFLTSVFTHMMPQDMENYISEITRVLKEGKICFATFFILDDESEAAMTEHGSKSFPYNFGNYYLMDKNVKEANVGFKKEYIFEVLKANDLTVTHFIRGNWSGAVPGELNEHQDILIFKK
jgi:ubiquinone/menaquinone biosynthesis C-methylase UbiE